MGPKKGRRLRKIQFPTDSVPYSYRGYAAADIQWRREAKEREEAQKQRQEEARREEEARPEETHSHEERVAEQTARTKKSDTETESAGGEAGPSQSQYKKGHMINIYLMDTDEEAIGDFVKDHKVL